MKAALARIGGILGTAVGLALSPIGINVLGVHASGIIFGVGVILHQLGVHVDLSGKSN